MTAYGKLAALNRAIAETIAIFASEEDARAQIHRDRQKMLVSSAL